jgi:predicted ATP-grasp superfamily ATP-dependent carboligase
MTRRSLEKPVLFPSSDDGLSLIAHHHKALQDFYQPVASNWDVIHLILDKRETYRVAQACQIPIPRTWAPQTLHEVHQIKKDVPYPCLLKPRVSHRFWPRFRTKVLRIQTPDELVSQYRRYAAIPWLIQEEIPGADDCIYTLRACINQASEPLALHVTQKLRQWPPHFGVGSYAQSVWEPTVVQQGLRILQFLGFYGIASVEFKRDPRTGTFHLIEINGRSGTMTALSTLCGVNTPYLAYCEARGRHPEPIDPTQCRYEVGCTWMHLLIDLRSVRQQQGTGALTAWLRDLLAPQGCYAIFAWDDLRPFLSELRRAILQLPRIITT